MLMRSIYPQNKLFNFSKTEITCGEFSTSRLYIASAPYIFVPSKANFVVLFTLITDISGNNLSTRVDLQLS